MFGSLFAMYFYLFGSHNTWPPTPPAGAKEFYVAVAPIPVINTIVEETIVRQLIPRLKVAGAEGIVEYPLNKVVY